MPQEWFGFYLKRNENAFQASKPKSYLRQSSIWHGHFWRGVEGEFQSRSKTVRELKLRQAVQGLLRRR